MSKQFHCNPELEINMIGTDAAREAAYFEFLDRNNRLWYSKAEALGWREPTSADEAQYQQTVSRTKSVQ